MKVICILRKRVIILLTMLLILCVSTDIKGQVILTFTNQADLDAYTFNSAGYYRVVLDNDTTLPLGQQIHDISNLANVRLVLLEFHNTRVEDFTPLSRAISALIFSGNLHQDTLRLNGIDTVSALGIENTTIRAIEGGTGIKYISNIYIEQNNHLKYVKLDIDQDTVDQFAMELYVQFNDSLEEFWWMNDKKVLRWPSFYENRRLRHIHLESLRPDKVISGIIAEIEFNPLLDSISGLSENDTVKYVKLVKNYNLSDACVFQKGVKAALADGRPASSYVIEDNAQGLRSLQDLLDADCSYLYVGVAETPGEGELPGIYPNPAVEEVYVTEYRAGEEYRLYDMSGRLVQRGLPAPGGRIGIIRLQPGFYVLEYGGQRIKMIKE